MKLTEFESSYIETMLWASCDDKDTPLDENYSEDDLAEKALLQVREDGFKFLEAIKDLEVTASDSQIAHDFFLTRNRHGAGFWDGDYPKELGEKLTKISHEFGECNPYVGDDGKIYLG